MPIEVDGTAPYAPPQAVEAVLDFDRNRGLPTPVTSDVIERVGVSASLAPRTLQSMRSLELLDADGMPTSAMRDLQRASGDQYQEKLAALLRSVYAEVFKFVDPAVDPPERVTDAFRHFTPVGMRDRMVTLFLGLCALAGIIEEAPKRRGRPPKIQASGAANKSAARRKTTRPSAPETPTAPTATPASLRKYAADDPLIHGLVSRLPEIGAEFDDAQRFEWVNAAQAIFNLLYRRPEPGVADRVEEPRVNATRD